MGRLTNSGYIHATERCPKCGRETSTWYPVEDGQIMSECGVCPECGMHVSPCSLCASTGYDCRKCVCGDMFEMHKDTEVYDKPNGRIISRRKTDKDMKDKANSYNVGTSDYSRHEIQPWDIVEMYGLNFFEGNILKYLLRKKGDRMEDLKKIQHYVEKYIEVVEQRAQRAIDETRDRVERMLKETDNN